MLNTKTLRVSNIQGYDGPLRMVEDRRGNRYITIFCSLEGMRYYGPLKRHHAAAFNAIADLQEVDKNAIDCGDSLPEPGRLRGTDVAGAQEEETEFFVFRLDAEYDQGDLDGHLRYLRAYSGTPDFLTRTETLVEAVEEARSHSPAAITNDLFEVISVTNEDLVES